MAFEATVWHGGLAVIFLIFGLLGFMIIHRVRDELTDQSIRKALRHLSITILMLTLLTVLVEAIQAFTFTTIVDLVAVRFSTDILVPIVIVLTFIGVILTAESLREFSKIYGFKIEEVKVPAISETQQATNPKKPA